ncbi:Hypothetical protein CINCED_3A014933 [Cinara cedri]|uniref:Uncharacterized protein n=1 Tax=Cinara cedri TaxID=506608 RepID=A0A5E4MR61_9HEMI|nr:Hypothetical protein CINCED_3A014933 [Cinara cedri]
MPDFPTRHCCGPRALVLILLQLHSTTATGFWTSDGRTALGLSGTVARALNRIRASARDQRLADGLWLERSTPVDGAAEPTTGASSKRPPADLLELADAVFDTHRLSWRNAIVPGIDFNVCKDRTQTYRFYVARNAKNSNGDTATRTFGVQRRRMQLIMLPIMYKLGVITTLLTGLTVLSLKGVTIGVILLMLAVTSIVARLHPPKYGAYGGGGGGWYAAASPWSGHDPFDRSSSQQQQSPDKNIHVHVHTAPGPAVSSAGMAMYRGPSAYDRDGSGPADDGGGGASYWNRGNDDYYYEAAAINHNNNYYYHNRPINNGAGPVESTTVSSVYHRWLG